MSDTVLSVTIESPEDINITLEDNSEVTVNFFETAQLDPTISTYKQEAESARDTALVAKTAAESAYASIIPLEQSVVTNAAESATNANNAQSSADAAALSESNASASESAAATSETNATNAASGAAISESNAVTAAQQAITAMSQLSNGYCYFGDQNTDGSWRFWNDIGTLKLQKRISGTWTDFTDFTL